MDYTKKTFTMKQLLIALGILLVIGFVMWENTKKVQFSDIDFSDPASQEIFIISTNNAIVELQRRAVSQQQSAQQAQQQMPQ